MYFIFFCDSSLNSLGFSSCLNSSVSRKFLRLYLFLQFVVFEEHVLYNLIIFKFSGFSFGLTCADLEPLYLCSQVKDSPWCYYVCQAFYMLVHQSLPVLLVISLAVCSVIERDTETSTTRASCFSYILSEFVHCSLGEHLCQFSQKFPL